MKRAPWKIWIDTGGTFTDCIGLDPDGAMHRCKVLSSGALRDRIVGCGSDGRLVLEGASELPEHFLRGYRISKLGDDAAHEIAAHDRSSGEIVLRGGDPSAFEIGEPVELRSGEEAPLLAARLITSTRLDQALPPVALRLATTRGTNALLERGGARTVHFITKGFEDLLQIGDQHRPDLFALHIDRPDPLPERVVGVDERVSAEGEILREMDLEPVRRDVAELSGDGFRCASITLLHGHRNPRHEELIEEILLEAGFEYIARSSALSPFQGLLRRSETCSTDAYLGPVISSYLGAVRSGLPHDDSSLHVMTSAGGLVNADNYHSMNSLLSGPAGGVVGAALTGRQNHASRIIAFDMGGTSTDVSKYDGDFEYVFSHRVGPVSLAVPALAIETVAAGGGSICRVERGRLAVGPESAGADPGPASYGAGGPLSLTDVNLLLGRLVPETFPIPVDLEAARTGFAELKDQLGGSERDEEVLEGLLRIANERMAEAIRHISVRKGVDPAGYALVAFGGAGGQHACRVAEILGIERVLLPGDAGLLSALGLGHAVIERFSQREVLRPLEDVADSLDAWFAELQSEAALALRSEGVDGDSIDTPRRILELRYTGQDASLEIEPESEGDLGRQFEDAYYRLFSYRPASRGIEVVSLRVVVRSLHVEGVPSSADGSFVWEAAPVARTQQCFLDGRWREVGCHEVADLATGSVVEGPALIQQEHSALVVPGGWRAESLGDGGLNVLRDPETSSGGETAEPANRPEAVELELMSHRFSSIATEMGELLKRTAISTNIKEREDFSCTLLDPEGRLVVNAPHIPVHLGAMGLCVRQLVAHMPMEPGDVVVTNHPAFGGSHLPDVTLVAPVHEGSRLLGYVTCRAHHAEIGGIRPGSVPPDAHSLAEEGVVLPPTLLMEGDKPRWRRLEEMLSGGPYPTRTLDDNLADLRAMLAAIFRGREALGRLASRVGFDHVVHHMDELRLQAAQQVRQALGRLSDGVHRGRQLLDDGAPLCAALTIDGDSAVLDFSGSAPVHPGNLNATPAIVHSVSMYVMRLLVEEDLPLNEGLLEPIEIRIPEGMLNPPYVDDPHLCPAVVGGNVETSQRLVDTLIEALQLAACSQGTMNNITFGNERFGYYETVGGGSGAVEGFDGESGVHCHMTNTRITDPEVIEHRYPVRLHRFSLRPGSGGAGGWRGGDGLIREIEFLEELEFSILSQHRVSAPFGMAGGSDGEVGRQVVIRADGTRHDLQGIDGCRVGAGDRVILETPGGGGWGEPG